MQKKTFKVVTLRLITPTVAPFSTHTPSKARGQKFLRPPDSPAGRRRLYARGRNPRRKKWKSKCGRAEKNPR